MQEHETLTGMDEATCQRLAHAGRAYKEAPGNLRQEIIDAGRRGDKPADIVKAIGHVYTYDYVARLVRENRSAQS